MKNDLESSELTNLLSVEPIRTFNRDGTPRKTRINKPKNFKWTEHSATVAYYCFRVGLTTLEKEMMAKHLGIGSQALATRINEFQIFMKYGKTNKVCQMTVSIYGRSQNLSKQFCIDEVKGILVKGFEIESLEEKEVIEEVELPFVISDIPVGSKNEIKLVQTKSIIDQIINSGMVDFNGEFINKNNLIILKDKSSLNFIETEMEGCYFIFSNLPKELIPVLSKDGFKCHELFIEKDGVEFRCLYNGKGNGVKERLKNHLFNSFTLDKVKQGKARTISGTGGMSLVSLPKAEFDELEKAGKFNPTKQKLKPVEKSIQPCSIDKRAGHQYFLNGIDIQEKAWASFHFAVIVLKSDSEFGKMLIEEAFCAKNGRPPLCKRHG